MCTLCADFRPWDIDCPYTAPTDANEAGSAQFASTLPVYTYDQIASQLTHGFWGGNSYSFDVAPGGTLTVDISGLNQSGQDMARLALQTWTEVSGIRFSEVAGTAPAVTRTEAGDAPGGTSGSQTLAVGEDFTGRIASGSDTDSVRMSLSAGAKVTLRVRGEDTGGDALAGIAVRLLDASGNVIRTASDAYGTEAAISFVVPASGTYFLEVAGDGGGATGDYRVDIRDIRSASQISFDDNQSGAYAQFWTSGGRISRSTINIDDNWAGGQNRPDGYFYQTYLHEIGHALGLGHAGNYNGSASYPGDASYLNDSWQASVMSYFYQTENTFVDASFAYVVTPQIADILAIHNLYGTPASRTGDDRYGTGAEVSGILGSADALINPVSYTVFDAGGTDVFDFAGHAGNQRLDLREETFSDLLGLKGNIGIARGTVIEYGITGDGDDLIEGNAAANGLTAGAGADTLRGRDGHDALAGGAGDDIADGGNGRDLLEGGEGSDQLTGGEDDDVIFGDDLTLADLTALFPTWTPPADAAGLLADGDLLALWADIQADVFAIA